MQSHRQQFIDLALRLGVLRFGEFTLKSGRLSPYFFNAGLFNTGQALATLGRCYADTIVQSGISFDMLFGPAYKGIPLVACTAAALAEHHARDVPYAFDRKETKDHGEGGRIIGSPLAGRVLIVDDVITAGTAIRASADLIQNAGATIAGVVLALDRQERGQNTPNEGAGPPQSAVQEVANGYGVPCVSIITLTDLIESLAAGGAGDAATVDAMRQYRTRYGV